MKKTVERFDDASFHVKFNLIMVGVRTLAMVPSVIWWRESVVWLVFMSWYANWVGHIAAWVAAKAEVAVEDTQLVNDSN
jgi:aryl carrier-like protein